MKEKLYSIQLASKLSGVNIHSIRAWERRYESVKPQRNDSGRRLYNEGEIEKLWYLGKLCHFGQSIGDIANLTNDDLKAIYHDINRRTEEGQHAAKVGAAVSFSLSAEESQIFEVDPDQGLQGLIMALQAYRLDVINHEMQKLVFSLSPRDFALKILTPLMVQLGDLVCQGKMNLAQEHAMLAIIKFHVGVIMSQCLAKKNKSGVTIALATPEGEVHEFGIMVTALLACQHNHKIFYFGTNLPADSFLEAAKAVECNVMILGAVQTYSETSDKLDRYVDHIIQTSGKNVRVAFGGNARLNLKSFAANSKFIHLDSFESADKFFASL